MTSALILSIVAVSVVFTCLLVLFGVYSLSGAIFSGKFRRGTQTAAPAADGVDDMAEDSDKALIAAAIAAALEAETGTRFHDRESGIITIRRAGGAWNNKSLTVRRTPNRKQ